MKDSNFKIISEFLECYFKTRKYQFKKVDIEYSDDLLELGVLNEVKSEVFQINTYSDELQKVVFEIANNKLKRQPPLDILEAFIFIDEFNDFLREENKTNIINAYDLIIKGFRVFILNYLHKNKVDIKKFVLLTYDDNYKGERYNKLHFFEQSLFKFLPSSNYSDEDIFKIVSALNSSKHTSRNITTGLLDLTKYNKDKSIFLLEYSLKKKEYKEFSYGLMIGLYNEAYYDVLDKIIELKSTDKTNCLYVLGRLKYTNQDDIEKAFDLIGNLDFENKEIANHQSFFLSNIAENPQTPDIIRDNAFRFYADFLEKASNEIKHIVFQDILYLKKNESKKYSLLRLYLTKTQNFEVINNFFIHFKDPKYIFDLMIELFSHNPSYKFPVNLFNNGISHLWITNQEESENEILNLFKQPPHLGMLAVNIILSHHGFEIYKVNLLKLNTEEHQINAIKSICKYPFSFDKLLLLILPLRNSKYKEVRLFLQKQLVEKVFKSYHDVIFKLICENITKNKKDKDFLKPIELAIEQYHKIKRLKESINDLNPYENEKDLMELYYRLEDEEKAKMMKSIDESKGGFMELAKKIIVVRGNSIKIDEREPTPFSKIESNFIVDSNNYLNPDLYEYNLTVL